MRECARESSISCHLVTLSKPLHLVTISGTSCLEQIFPEDKRPPMVITIDGPAGTGKSSVALAVADRLDSKLLDTGAMYRAVALEALRRGTNLQDPRELAFVARHARIE